MLRCTGRKKSVLRCSEEKSVFRCVGRDKSVLKCLRKKSVFKCLGREECADVLRK